MDVRQVVAECGVQGIASGRRLARAGVTRSQLSRAVAAGVLVRLARGVYALEELPPLPRYLVTDAGCAPEYAARVRAALLEAGPAASASGRTAAVLRGWPLLVEPTRSVELSVPHAYGRASARGAAVVRRRVLEREVVAGLPVTSAVQTVLDCALSLPVLQAVVVCDSALRARAVTFGELQSAARSLRGVREAARARRVLERADPLSGSVLESVQRVRMLASGLGGFETQVVLRQWPELRVDFCFVAERLVVEVDGQRWHQDWLRDQARDNAIAALGWRVLRFTWGQVLHDEEYVLGVIAAALGRATTSTRSGLGQPRRAA